MQEITLEKVCGDIETAINTRNWQLVEALLWPAMDQYPDIPILSFYAGNYFFQTDRNQMSTIMYERGLRLEPNPVVMSNVGAALRRMGRMDEATRWLRKSVGYEPDNANAWTNLCATYVNEGNPDAGLAYGKRALKCRVWGADKDYVIRRAKWNMGLLYLERGDFKRGFGFYREALGDQRPIRSYGTQGNEEAVTPFPEPQLLDAKLHSENKKKGKTLVVWGEQGIGDELMMASMIPDAMADYNVIFDCHPRLEWFFRQKWPDLAIHPTRKNDYIDWPLEEGLHVDFKLPIGDLGHLYRKERRDFQTAWRKDGPFYTWPEAEADEYRARLKRLAKGRKIVGLATRGGYPSTARFQRSIKPDLLGGLLARDDILYVCLDYEDMSLLMAHVEEHHGADRMVWYPALLHAWDYHHTAALVAACDAVVTVCQSVAHLSASIGQKTFVMAPHRVAWRYGLKSKDWYWYPSPKTQIYRQAENGDWTGAHKELMEDLDATLGRS